VRIGGKLFRESFKVKYLAAVQRLSDSSTQAKRGEPSFRLSCSSNQGTRTGGNFSVFTVTLSKPAVWAMIGPSIISSPELLANALLIVRTTPFLQTTT
jgi:hypothetical protein